MFISFRLFSLIINALIIFLPSLAASSILPETSEEQSQLVTQQEQPSLNTSNTELSSKISPLYPYNYYGKRTEFRTGNNDDQYYQYDYTDNRMKCQDLCIYQYRDTQNCPLSCPEYLASTVFPQFFELYHSDKVFPEQFFVAMSIYNTKIDYYTRKGKFYHEVKPHPSFNTVDFINNVNNFVTIGSTEFKFHSHVAMPSLIRNLLKVSDDYPEVPIMNLPYPKKNEANKNSDIENYKAFKHAFIQNNDKKKQSCMETGRTPEECIKPVISIKVDDIDAAYIDLILESGLEMFLPPVHHGDENCKKTTRDNLKKSGYNSDFRKFFRNKIYQSNPFYYEALYKLNDAYKSIFGVDYVEIIPVKAACHLLKVSEPEVAGQSDTPSSVNVTTSDSERKAEAIIKDSNSGEQRTPMFAMVALSLMLTHYVLW